jgi:hypothetical protein
MRGNNNKIIINQATMQDAVQYWLTSQYVAGRVPTVSWVRMDGQDFTVMVDEPKKKAPDNPTKAPHVGFGPRAEDC